MSRTKTPSWASALVQATRPLRRQASTTSGEVSGVRYTPVRARSSRPSRTAARRARSVQPASTRSDRRNEGQAGASGIRPQWRTASRRITDPSPMWTTAPERPSGEEGGIAQDSGKSTCERCGEHQDRWFFLKSRRRQRAPRPDAVAQPRPTARRAARIVWDPGETPFGSAARWRARRILLIPRREPPTSAPARPGGARGGARSRIQETRRSRRREVTTSDGFS